MKNSYLYLCLSFVLFLGLIQCSKLAEQFLNSHLVGEQPSYMLECYNQVRSDPSSAAILNGEPWTASDIENFDASLRNPFLNPIAPISRLFGFNFDVLKNEDKNELIDIGHAMIATTFYDPRYSSTRGLQRLYKYLLSIIYGAHVPVPETELNFRLSLIRNALNSMAFPKTITQLKKLFETQLPQFTDNLENWLNTLELFSNSPSEEQLSEMIRNNELSEDFITVIKEKYGEDFITAATAQISTEESAIDG